MQMANQPRREGLRSSPTSASPKMLMTRFHQSFWLIAIVLATVSAASAQSPELQGELRVDPPQLNLVHRRWPHSILVTGRTSLGQTVDLTREAKVASVDEKIARVRGDGQIEPVANGETDLRIEAKGKVATVHVRVTLSEKPEPASFRDEVMPVLSKASCNMGACHGYSLGKNGFKLSLRGADPDADFLALTEEFYERRINRHQPEASLLVAKPRGDVPHKGGVRFTSGTLLNDLLLHWIREGAPADLPEAAKFVSLSIEPAKVVLGPDWKQQLQVIAKYSNGATRDVTRLSVFTVNNERIVTASDTGLISAQLLGQTAVSARFERTFATAEFLVLEPKADFQATPVPDDNLVDKHVVARLNSLQIRPSEMADDATFLRRVTLDLIGIQPTPEEIGAFLADARPDKRDRWIDALLARPEFVDQWSLKWGDLLQNSRNRLSDPAMFAFREWIRGAVDSNMPLDEFARKLLLSQGGVAESPSAAYYAVSQDTHETLQRATQVFCGVRMLCAKCHPHPFENWTQDDYYGLYNFFNQVGTKADPRLPNVQNARSVVLNLTAGIEANPRSGKPQPPRFLGGVEPEIKPGADRRGVYAAWLTAKENPLFARSMTNRIWSYFFHRGIIDPVDDLRSTNPPINPDLLDALTKDFVEHKFDVKHLMRVIVRSRTYQRSSVPNDTNRHEDANFSRFVPRRLPAESLLDSLVQATGVPESFRGAPGGFTARQLPDGTSTSDFLMLFGKPVRAEACECERDNGSNMLQALHFINGPSILGRLTNGGGRVAQLVQKEKDDGALVDQLYLWTICRKPSEAERKQAIAFIAGYEGKRLEAAQDYTWGLLNSRDFLMVQ